MVTRAIAYLSLLTACGPPGALRSYTPWNAEVTEVVVSRREVRVRFPRERLEKLRFSDAEAKRAYIWSVLIPETVDDASISGRVFPGYDGGMPRPVPTFPTLDSLARSGFAYLCTGELGHYGGRCTHNPAEVSLVASGSHMVLVLRDSAQIARLFSLRPSRVRSRRLQLGESVISNDSVPVRYVDPQIPLPDSAMFARRRATIDSLAIASRSVTRSIAFANDIRYDVPGWMQVGDSVRVGIREETVRGSAAVGVTIDHHRGTWTIVDTTVVRPGVTALPQLPPGVRGFWLVGRSVGRTTVTALNIPPYQGPRLLVDPPTNVPGAVVVIPRLGSIRLFVASDTMVENTPLRVRVEARTAAGDVVAGVPVLVRSETMQLTTADSGYVHRLRPGVSVITAQFWSLADTVRVVVRPK
jgi:hypothetical protein